MTWTVTSAHPAAVVCGVVLLGVGIAAGRADVALVGVPVLAAAVLGRGRVPAEPVRARLVDPEDPTQPGRLRSTLHLDGPPEARLAHLRLNAPGHKESQVVVALDRHRELELGLASVRTGPQETFTVGLRAYDGAGIAEQEPTEAHGGRRLVLPGAQPLGRLPLPGRLRGLTGPHTSRRLGDGHELRDIHPFAPGDRLRRIDWRTTARRSPDLDTLHVRRTHATAEATAVLVVDSRDDVGPDVRTWRGLGTRRVDEPTSLDLARHAAASVATALVDVGDRVGLEDLARRRRPLPPASGRRHLRRLLHALALAHPVDQASVHLVRPPQVPADAIVYLFTTVLDDEPVRLVRTWRETGHEVVVVDTLPDPHAIHETHLLIGWRIARLERELRLEALRREGIPVVRWAGSRRPHASAELEAVALAATRRRR